MNPLHRHTVVFTDGPLTPEYVYNLLHDQRLTLTNAGRLKRWMQQKHPTRGVGSVRNETCNPSVRLRTRAAPHGRAGPAVPGGGHDEGVDR